MMRLRRASMIAALLLVASTATAHAGCAWIIWFKGYPPNQDPRAVQIRWTLTEYIYETKRECDERAHQETRDWVKLMQASPKEFMLGSYVCYPDTVDPRGPKGK